MSILFEGAAFHALTAPEQAPAQAMAVEKGRIMALGEAAELRDRFPRAKRVDLAGSHVVPAFNDCHCHVMSLGQHLDRADLRGSDSPEEIARRLKDWSRANPDRLWVEGGAYDQNPLPGSKHLTLAELDAMVPDRPTRLYHVSGHLTLLNTKALEACGICADTPDPSGGRIDRNASGRASGLLLETAMDIAEAAMPQPGRSEIKKYVLLAGKNLAERGILAATDAWRGRYGLETEWQGYVDALDAGCPIRATLMPETDYMSPAGWLDSRPGLLWEQRANLRLGAWKICADGALTSRTAAMLEPFEDTGDKGMLIYEPERLKDIILRAHKAGWQIAVHAIGDYAVALVLEGLEAAQAARPRRDARHRIEHCMVINDEQIAAMARLGVLAAVQPEFLYTLGRAYQAGLGERADRMMPYASFIKAGVRVAFGSDQPVVPGDPIIGWRAAVTRLGRDGHEFAPEEALDPITALKCYTVEAAWAGHDEEIGVLAPGRLADFAVLNLPPDRILDETMAVTATSRDFGVGLPVGE